MPSKALIGVRGAVWGEEKRGEQGGGGRAKRAPPQPRVKEYAFVGLSFSCEGLSESDLLHAANHHILILPLSICRHWSSSQPKCYSRWLRTGHARSPLRSLSTSWSLRSSDSLTGYTQTAMDVNEPEETTSSLWRQASKLLLAPQRLPKSILEDFLFDLLAKPGKAHQA